MTFNVKIGYNTAMFGLISILLRFFLIVALWGFIWHLIVPKTRLGRIFRAAVLVAALVLARLIIAAGR